MKLYTAFRLMEKQKQSEPRYSESFKEIASFILISRAGTNESKNASLVE